MKPIRVKRINKEVGARVRYVGKYLGTIVGGLQVRTFKWNWSRYFGDYMSSFSSEGYLVKFFEYKNEKGEDTFPVRDNQLTFLDRIVVEKQRKCPNLKQLVNNLEPHEVDRLRSLLNELK